MPKSISQKQIDEIKRRFEAGESKTFIAKEMGLSDSTVGNHTPKVLKHTFITEELNQKIISLVKSGMSKVEVARSLGLAPTTVQKYSSNMRRTTRKAPIPPEKMAEVIRRNLAGESVTSIARDLNISHASAYKFAGIGARDFELSDAQKMTIKTEFANGKSNSRIASDLAISLFVVNKFLGIDVGIRYSKDLAKEFVRAVESGETMQDAAKRLGVPWKTAYCWFKDALAKGEVQKPKKHPEKTDDHQFTWIARRDPRLEEWRQMILGWIAAKSPVFSTTLPAITAFIEAYLVNLNLPRKPADLLQRGQLLPDFYETACHKSPSGRRYNTIIHDLIEWVLDSPAFADVDGDTPIRLTDLYRNPINPNAGGDEATPRNRETNKVVLPYFLIADLRKRIVQGPNFSDWKWLQGMTGRETKNGTANAGDWFNVTENRIDRNDPDCVWRLRKRGKRPPVLEMWSPVRWVHVLIHLQTTTRSGQLRMVDSGEADTFIWKEGQFVPNLSPLRLGTVKKPRQQGVFRRPTPQEDAEGAKVSIYFNSNKTADRGRFGAEKGFECPWPQMPIIEEDPYYWLAKLRDWQMKYNPIKRLTPWCELRGSSKLSVITGARAAEYPDTAFLFRAAENADHPTWPIRGGECYNAWQKLLAAYEAILAEEDIKHPSGEPIELINPVNGLAWSSPHATRPSLITHLILDGDVSPAIMMKIAGHARFIMTIYYTKAGLAGIQQAIKAGTEKLEATKYQMFERDLLGAKAEQMRKKIVFNAEDWRMVLPVNPADRNPLGWMHMHDGICLAGGNTGGEQAIPGCHNGGPVTIAATKDRSARYGPVPGGVRNCCRCRWRAAGKPHLLGLAATFDNRAYHMHKQKDVAIAAERERNRLMQEKARIESSNEPYTRMRELIDTERRYEASMQRFQELAIDLAALHRTIERVMALPDNADGPTALAVQGDLLTVNMVIENTDSELLHLAAVCADVEFFPDLDPGTAIFEFAQLLDHAFDREGQPMVLARLSQREKLAAANAIMRELERKANPDNPILGRRLVVEIIDRGESLEKMLGVKLKSVFQVADGRNHVSLRLVQNDGGRS